MYNLFWVIKSRAEEQEDAAHSLPDAFPEVMPFSWMLLRFLCRIRLFEDASKTNTLTWLQQDKKNRAKNTARVPLSAHTETLSVRV